MKEFVRKMYISAVVSSCLLFGFCACCIAYRNIRQVGFGEYRNAIEIEEDTFRFFDYEKELKKK
jgi:hypothetical protein